MDKRLAILVGILGLMTVCVALKCHKCTSASEKENEPCRKVEKGKSSNFTSDCPAAIEGAGKVVCKTRDLSNNGIERDCLTVKKDDKIGCKDAEGGGKVCYCDTDNCNGKSSALLGWGYNWLFTSILLSYYYYSK